MNKVYMIVFQIKNGKYYGQNALTTKMFTLNTLINNVK